ncbi:hypothetical protein NCC49_005683 [Naganishia albida]|nr:hypothetical protein NCC49_005683 [Naganishia albida]
MGPCFPISDSATASMIHQGIWFPHRPSTLPVTILTDRPPLLSQALECIKLLLEKSPLPIERARMKVRLTMPNRDGKRLKERVLACAEKVEEDDMTSDEWEVIMLIDPGQFRVLNELLEAETKGRGRMESMGYAAVTTEEKLE